MAMVCDKTSVPILKNTDAFIRKAVVLGGSFNPPTIAHSKVLLSGVGAVNADLGIFIPAPFAYVKKKLKKIGQGKEAMPDDVRLELLNIVSRESSRLTVDDYEMRRLGKGFTFETLEAMAQKYPNAEIYFLIGADKLHIVSRWHKIDELLEKFRILVAKRNGEIPELMIKENPYLYKHKDKFYIFDFSDDVEEISSSAVRKLLREGDEKAREMLSEGVWEYIRRKQEMDKQKTPKVPDNSIWKFRNEYDFLSNFYPCQIEYHGLHYQNAEAAFQAQKCMAQEEKKKFCELPSNQAKQMGKKVKLRPDWEQVKVSIMEEVVRAKFIQNPFLAEKLLSTGELLLIEGNTWKDMFWGIDIRNGKGENHLGQILMKIRKELREKEDASTSNEKKEQ